MREERYFTHHAELYQRLLILAFLVVGALGVHSVMARSGESGPNSPKSEALGLTTGTQPQTAKSVKPVKLPGNDGSTKDSANDPTPAAKPDAQGNVVMVDQPVVAPVQPAVIDTATISLDATRQLGRDMNAAMFGDDNWSALDKLWTRESNWNVNARNRSGACGIPQALPCSKIPDMSTTGQITWGLNYIKSRYGTPQAAWAHSQNFGWY
jgi:hypothetical protein